ncbi:MAG: hypothetical protein ABGW81_05800 [Paracoccaceae bacterium]
MGDKMVNPGTPMGKSMIISSEGVSETDSGLNGNTIVEAADLDEASRYRRGVHIWIWDLLRLRK